MVVAKAVKEAREAKDMEAMVEPRVLQAATTPLLELLVIWRALTAVKKAIMPVSALNHRYPLTSVHASFARNPAANRPHVQ